VWAVLRARDTGTEEVDGARSAPGWVAVLMLVLAITAVAMKVVAHNPTRTARPRPAVASCGPG
jgi:hypothetical protein